MEHISETCAHLEKNIITMPPLIDLNPNDLTSIYSTLLHAIDLAFKMNIPTPSITFDHALWVKAIVIMQPKKLKIDMRLRGGFHCLMSFIGSIGMCTEGSALKKLLLHVYSGKNVSLMMSGKAISRVLRELY